MCCIYTVQYCSYRCLLFATTVIKVMGYELWVARTRGLISFLSGHASIRTGT